MNPNHCPDRLIPSLGHSFSTTIRGGYRTCFYCKGKRKAKPYAGSNIGKII